MKCRVGNFRLGGGRVKKSAQGREKRKEKKGEKKEKERKIGKI